jgi:hypothetical protein
MDMNVGRMVEGMVDRPEIKGLESFSISPSQVLQMTVSYNGTKNSY